MEWFSGKKTPGRRRPVPDNRITSKEIIFHRTHNVDLFQVKNRATHCPVMMNGKYLFKRVLILIRNYKESFVRCDRSHRKMKRYFKNLMYFEEYPKEKLLIYYEDLVTDFSAMCRILDFMKIPYDLSNFDVDSHRKQSFNRYKETAKRPYDSAKSPLGDVLFHSSK